MAEPSLIAAYKAVLLAELPLADAEEVSDGLGEAYAKYLQLGLGEDDAAGAAIAEFGSARSVVEAFSRASPARRAARMLVATGPAVGLCWTAAMITDQAWKWPVPLGGRALLGGLLVGSILVLVTAVRARGYRTVRRSGAAGCLGLAVVDASMITAVLALEPGIQWLTVVAVLASAARLTGIARAVPPMLA